LSLPASQPAKVVITNAIAIVSAIAVSLLSVLNSLSIVCKKFATKVVLWLLSEPINNVVVSLKVHKGVAGGAHYAL
jgi:hypothetical protein